MKTMILENWINFGVAELSEIEKIDTNGGGPGDAAELIGRSWVWATLHVFTFGLSTTYGAAKKLLS
ncbi:MAG TPA: hypothetical protein PKE30_11015 [Niabella sp.]|nr:hypothetical protein [Niabella sp.]